MARLIDSFGRTIDYLRVSLTDHCNLRCVYCLPADHVNAPDANGFLTDDELIELLSRFTALGISKIRLTGGEPLLRPGLEDIVSRIAALPGVEDLSLSTNGVLLKRKIGGLARSGLKRVNVSVDTLDPSRFREMTRHGNLEDVLAGLEEAMRCGLSPVKINVVALRGFNDREIPRFVALTQDRPLHVRFIELMPMGDTDFVSDQKRVTLEEMLERAGPLDPLPRGLWPQGHGPARYYRKPGALGTVGFISAVSCGFCSGCNRMRLSAKGMLYPCLDDAWGVDLKAGLRDGSDRRGIAGLILQAVDKKPERHFMAERFSAQISTGPRSMCQVGG